jgi:hypothetical protein
MLGTQNEVSVPLTDSSPSWTQPLTPSNKHQPDMLRIYTGTRRYLLKRYPYAVIYRELDDLIWVVAVAHGKRRPGYWKSRT